MARNGNWALTLVPATGKAVQALYNAESILNQERAQVSTHTVAGNIYVILGSIKNARQRVMNGQNQPPEKPDALILRVREVVSTSYRTEVQFDYLGACRHA